MNETQSVYEILDWVCVCSQTIFNAVIQCPYKSFSYPNTFLAIFMENRKCKYFEWKQTLIWFIVKENKSQ